MAATHLIITQACGCPYQGTLNLEDPTDAAWAARVQRRRCLAHRYPSPAPSAPDCGRCGHSIAIHPQCGPCLMDDCACDLFA